MAEIQIHVGYFLEDIGHEDFLKSLVERMALEMGLTSHKIRHDVRNATGGEGVVLRQLRDFLDDVKRERQQPFDLLIVAVDSNCHGYRKRRREIGDIVDRSGYPSTVVYAVPDPYVEYWYLADPCGFQKALETTIVPQVPAHKCEPGRYKQASREAIRQTGIIAPPGGIEFGPDIAQNLDLYAVGKADSGFKHFIDGLREQLSPFARSEEEV